jgi:hypothetical protein
MAEYLAVFGLFAACLIGMAYYFSREYRRAVRLENRRVEQLLVRHRVEELEKELDYLRRRNEVLMNGLFPRGDVFPGNFIEGDPELQALTELLHIMRGRAGVAESVASATPPSA